MQEPPKQPIINFPKSKFGNESRSFNGKYYQLFPWIEYSVLQDSIFCYPCRFFNFSKSKPDQIFIKKGFKNWKRASEKGAGFSQHSNSFLHKNSMVCWASYKQQQQQNQSVGSQISKARQTLIKENRDYLKIIIESVLFLAHQGLALRSHDESESSGNKGNFLELLTLLSKHNEVLYKKLKLGPKNAKYTHHTIQNEILEIASNLILSKISSQVKKAKYFSVMADETKDIRKVEQVSVVVKYYLDGKIYERFLGYRPADDLNADSMFNYIKERLSICGIDINNCVGQTYDGASVMRGKNRGVQALFREQVPQAIYVHCFNHRLNLVIVKVCKNIPECNDFFSLLESLYVFISGSSIHSQFLKIQKEISNDAKPIELKKLSDTRWSSQISCCQAIKKTLGAVLILLNKIELSNNERSSEAKGLLNNINFTFVFNLSLFCEVLEILKKVSDYLQGQDTDIIKSMELISSTKQMMTDFRNDTNFEKMYLQSIKCADDNGIEVDQFPKKRIRKFPQKFKNLILLDNANFENKSVVDKSDYKIKIYFNVFDRIINEMDRRFTDNCEILKGFSTLNPKSIVFLNIDTMRPLLLHYNCDEESAQVEIKLLHKTLERYNKEKGHIIESLTDLTKFLDEYKLAFHEIYKLCCIAITIPSSSAGCERSFSVLKRIKTYLRNSTGQSRLTNLSIINIEKELITEEDSNDIIDTFATVHNNRRILLL